MTYPDPHSSAAKRYLRQTFDPCGCYFDSTTALDDLTDALLRNKKAVLERLKKV